MFFISPPFGNYISLPYTKSISGSFTLERRDGLYAQIIKTLHYSYEHGGWVNKIGLRNKGLDWAIKNVKNDEILSIAILHPTEIDQILQKLPENRDIEINISCPNAEKKMVSTGISKFINPTREWCILKVSPTMKNEDLKNYYDQGFRQFHCCNTLPVKDGGLSGKTLIPYTSEKTEYIKAHLPNSIVIAGGGVDDIEIANKYERKGADHFSASTIFFNPFKSAKLYGQYLWKIAK